MYVRSLHSCLILPYPIECTGIATQIEAFELFLEVRRCVLCGAILLFLLLTKKKSYTYRVSQEAFLSYIEGAALRISQFPDGKTSFSILKHSSIW